MDFMGVLMRTEGSRVNATRILKALATDAVAAFTNSNIYIYVVPRHKGTRIDVKNYHRKEALSANRA